MKEPSLEVVALNVGGFLMHKDEIEDWIYSDKLDIVCLSETHITGEINDNEVNIENYEMIRVNSNNTRTGGVLTYIKKSINFNILDFSDLCIKGTWFNIIQINGLYKIFLCTLYRSPNSSISIFCNKIIELAETLSDLGKVVLVGDFTIDVNRKNNYYVNKLINSLAVIGYTQHIKVPTRTTKTSDTIIDLVFCNYKLSAQV